MSKKNNKRKAPSENEDYLLKLALLAIIFYCTSYVIVGLVKIIHFLIYLL